MKTIKELIKYYENEYEKIKSWEDSGEDSIIACCSLYKEIVEKLKEIEDK